MTANDLIRGRVYRVSTRFENFSGEYLGMEAPYGDWAMLFQSVDATTSVGLNQLHTLEEVL